MQKKSAGEYYQKNYKLITHYILTGKGKEYIGDRNKKVCRFCKKSFPYVTFKNKAHAFPEYIGNTILFSNDECDICNKKFGEHHETHLGNYLLPDRAALGIKKKSRKPTFKINYNHSKIFLGKHQLKIMDTPEKRVYKINEEKKEIEIEFERKAYIPRAVFKCLAKMAISIAPEVELPFLKDTIDWINNIDYGNDNCHPSSEFKILFIRFPRRLGGIEAYLYKRKRDDFQSPYMIFGILFSDLFFQIVLPFTQKDYHLINKTTEYRILPLSRLNLRGHPDLGSPEIEYENFSSINTIKNEKVIYKFRYENLIIHNEE